MSRTLAALQNFLTRQSQPTQLIVVDDGSDAFTQRLLESARHAGPMTVLRNDRNRGKGYSVGRGMLAAEGALRVFTDADLPYPEAIEDVVDALERGADVAIACRAHAASRFLVNADLVPHLFARRIASRALNALAQRVLVRDVFDTQAGLKGFTSAAAETIFSRLTIPRFGFDLECLYIASRHGLRVERVPVTCCVDSADSSVGLVRDSMGMLRDLGIVRLNAWRGRYG